MTPRALVEREAHRQNKSISALIREALEAFLGVKREPAKAPGFAALGRSGRKHTARNAEKILEREWVGDRRR